jgi:hypothetical protein
LKTQGGRCAIQGLTAFLRLGLVAAVLASLAQAPIKDPLARARSDYNAGQFDLAIEAATEARQNPKTANAATLVLARAKLERFRSAFSRGEQAPDDLVIARDMLKKIDVAALTPRDRIEYLTGVGVSLYLEDLGGGQQLYGAAAEYFELALSTVDASAPDMHETILEWWAGSLDRQAQLAPNSERRKFYARILLRAEREVELRDLSPAAMYWLAAAARGTDDVERAYSAAVAGWIRAPQTGAAGARLRDDLDRLVIQAILPERARIMVPIGDPRPTEMVLRAYWDELKVKWEK